MEINLALLSFTGEKMLFLILSIFEWVSSVYLNLELIKCAINLNL